MRAALLVLTLFPGPVLAQTPMTADEFDAFTTGKTMDYIAEGTIFGREVYLPGRRVRWAFTAEECRSGSWYADGPHICFLYDDDPQPKCWLVWRDGDGLAASYITDLPGTTPRQVLETDEPLACEGPDVGV
jgi:hypothetical protein